MFDLLLDIGKAAALIGGGFAGAVFGADRILKAMRMLGKAPAWYERVWSEKAHALIKQEERDARSARLIDRADTVLSVIESVPHRLDRIESRLTQEFGNGVPPDHPDYVPLRATLDGYRVSNAKEHERLGDNIETLYEMYGTQHDDLTNLGLMTQRMEAKLVETDGCVTRHDLWIAKHDELTARQGAS